VCGGGACSVIAAYIYASSIKSIMEEKEIKTILAILFDIQKDVRSLKKHLGVEKEKKEEKEEKEKKEEKRKLPSELEAYPTAKEILEEGFKKNERS
jgi:beta-phosphoglucomutase-like phosphatase (HAD superfamily)